MNVDVLHRLREAVADRPDSDVAAALTRHLQRDGEAGVTVQPRDEGA